LTDLYIKSHKSPKTSLHLVDESSARICSTAKDNLMAISATIIQFQIQLSDIDRHCYQTLNLRMAQHPSETDGFLLCRLFAYCLHYEEGIFFSKGLCAPEEPAVGIQYDDGRFKDWIEVGVPSIDRVKKAVRLSEQVRIYSYRSVKPLLHAARKDPKVEKWGVEITELPTAFVEKIEPEMTRKNDWQLVRTEDTIYLTLESGACVEHHLQKTIMGKDG
jgi:uncharacterized protein YaeQ